MRLSVSNIAWQVEQDEIVADLLLKNRVHAIDVAPSKYFPDPANVEDHEVVSVKDWWADREIDIVGMQSLLFGTKELNVFGSSETVSKMLTHLAGICRVGRLLGGTKLVFGSPRNRDKGYLSPEEVLAKSVLFFSKLGDIALDAGVTICLEPNPTQYGANFMINTDETASIVNSIGHPAIKMQLDLGSLAMNNEDLEDVLSVHSSIIGHIHISEPNLVPIGDAKTDHSAVAVVLNRYFKNGTATLEMLSDGKDKRLESLERALHASRFYLDVGVST